jgi:hypothetical protein
MARREAPEPTDAMSAQEAAAYLGRAVRSLEPADTEKARHFFRTEARQVQNLIARRRREGLPDVEIVGEVEALLERLGLDTKEKRWAKIAELRGKVA